MKVQISHKEKRLQEAWKLALSLSKKYNIDIDLMKYLVVPLASINPYYFDTEDNLFLYECTAMEVLTDKAKDMQFGALRRVNKEFQYFHKRLERWFHFKTTGYFEAITT